MAIKSNLGAYETARPDDLGPRGGGRRRGKPLLQRIGGSWKKDFSKMVSRNPETTDAQRAGGTFENIYMMIIYL